MRGSLIMDSWDLTLFILVGGYRYFIEYESPTVRVRIRCTFKDFSVKLAYSSSTLKMEAA
jgi:hypothetical protein